MVKKARCSKCVHCEYENKYSNTIGCKIFGRCDQKHSCEHFMTEIDYRTALESLRIIEEINNNGRN